jgi:hypothetical protein
MIHTRLLPSIWRIKIAMAPTIKIPFHCYEIIIQPRCRTSQDKIPSQNRDKKGNTTKYVFYQFMT